MFWNKKPAPPSPSPTPKIEFTRAPKRTSAQALADAIKSNFKAPKINGLPYGEMIATQDYQSFGGYNGLTVGDGIPSSLLSWYGAQSFIGFQICLIFSQHWLINAACEIPGQDALRKGHEISDDSGVDISPEVLKKFKKFNKKINLNEKAEEFSKFARVFGYRIAIFNIDGIDYESPFNPDGIKLGSYQGISMPDPYYVAPQLSGNFNPASPDFFEPEYWLVSGKRYHKSHCIIYRHCIVPQLLKPVYLYGGISMVQQIYEKVYQAESASNEANRLLMTKRLLVRKGDVMSAITDEISFNEKMDFFRDTRDNYGEQLIDTTEDLAQLETGLAEVAEVITQRYEQVAAIARMPANKLMQTQLQGFASSGEAEESIYNGMLETLQEQCFTPFLERHYLCAARSLGISANEYEIIWPPIDTITEKEQAEINQIKATTDQINVTGNGALSGEDVRGRLVKDKNSGYHGIKEALPEIDYSDDNEASDNEQTNKQTN